MTVLALDIGGTKIAAALADGAVLTHRAQVPTPQSSADDAWEKVREEADEVRAADSADALEDEIGDLLFAVVNYARLQGVVPETALRRTVDKFSRRFQTVEAHLGDRMAEAGLEEMDALWEASKREVG